MATKGNTARRPVEEPPDDPPRGGLPPLPATDNGPGAAESPEPHRVVSLSRKAAGAYYTPDSVTVSLIRWVVRSERDRMLDPACGDGRFISRHWNSVGIEKDVAAARQAAGRAGNALVHNADFFAWAEQTTERFDCAAGNPPFIRYQTFKSEARARALALCADAGVVFSGLTSSWAPFLVVAASLLKRGGRVAFVVPAEIGHAPYAAPALEYFVQSFSTVQIIAVRKKLFPNLSEDCWLLYADNFGGKASEILFSVLDVFCPTATPPAPQLKLSLFEWRRIWRRRLRPLLIPTSARELYQHVAERPDTKRLSDLASVGIGYVTGGNDFFHLRPSQAEALDLPSSLLQPTVRNSRYLLGDCLTVDAVSRWQRADEPVLLLHIPKELAKLPRSVNLYLESAAGQQARSSYKCLHRNPWYSVPDVHVPEFFLTYLSGRRVGLVRNQARITCTNALHYVRLRDGQSASNLVQAWQSPFTQLSCELEGHPLGGGVLKLEPREASAVLLPSATAKAQIDEREVAAAIATMQSWRHYC